MTEAVETLVALLSLRAAWRIKHGCYISCMRRAGFLSLCREENEGDESMTSLADLKKRLLASPDVKAEYNRLGPVYALVGA